MRHTKPKAKQHWLSEQRHWDWKRLHWKYFPAMPIDRTSLNLWINQSKVLRALKKSKKASNISSHKYSAKTLPCLRELAKCKSNQFQMERNWNICFFSFFLFVLNRCNGKNCKGEQWYQHSNKKEYIDCGHQSRTIGQSWSWKERTWCKQIWNLLSKWTVCQSDQITSVARNLPWREFKGTFASIPVSTLDVRKYNNSMFAIFSIWQWKWWFRNTFNRKS